MHLTVPAASRTLKKLRTTFDDTLFIRSNPLFLPSAKANELYPQVKDILQKLGQLIDPEEFSPQRLKRTFRLGVVDNAIHTVLTEFIENFYKISPDCTLEFQYLDSRIFDKLEDNRLDVAILPTTEEVRGKIRQFLLYPNHFVLCVRRGHPLVQYYKEHGSVPASEIAKYRKVIVSNCLDVAKRTYTMDETTFDDEFKQEIACSTPYFTSVPNFLIHSDFTLSCPMTPPSCLKNSMVQTSRFCPLPIVKNLPTIQGSFGTKEPTTTWLCNGSEVYSLFMRVNRFFFGQFLVPTRRCMRKLPQTKIYFLNLCPALPIKKQKVR